MRWKPNRAGIFNVWEYDDQLFEFGDGRLVLRGRNGSGKSNALALLFPFLLDGVMSAARMDPMGGARSMKSLLLGRDDDDPKSRYQHDSGTGYVWMEFVRGAGEPDEFVTIGVGASATQQRDADAWFFITDRRVGHDLELADGDVPLGRRQLAERLDEQVMTTADEFRSALDRHLFGLGVGRHRTLVDLLLTLRRPHLAGKLDTDHLSATLSAGLAELDASLIDDVAHSFDDLDAMQHELDGLATSLDAVERFLPVYREHLVGVARSRASAVVARRSELDSIDSDRMTTERERTEHSDRQREHEQLIEQLAAEHEQLGVAIETIQQSPAYQDATALSEVQRAAEAAERGARQAADRAATAAAEAERANDAAASARGDHATAVARIDSAVDEWVSTGLTAGIDVRFDDVGFDADRATALVTERRDDVDRVHRLALAAADATRQAERAETEAQRRRGEFDEANEKLNQASGTVDVERETLSHLRAGWTGQVDELVAQFGTAIGEQVRGVGEVWPIGTSDPVRKADDDEDIDTSIGIAISEVSGQLQAADRCLADAVALAERHTERANRDVDDQLRVVDLLVDDRQQVADEPNPGPPPNATRPDADRSDRPGVPLYVCVDFAGHVAESDRAGLEAALAAAGLLDARVTAGGINDEALDARFTTNGSPPQPSPSLADVLVPIETGGVGAAEIASVLQSIPLAGEVVELRSDGRWRLGPLAGRFTQPEQRYIGHEARERRRSARLAELDGRLEGERATLQQLQGRHDLLASLHDQLVAQRSAQPPIDRLTGALESMRHAATVAAARRTELDRAAEQVDERSRVADVATSDLHRATVATRLPADADALVEVTRALTDCDRCRDIIVERQRALAIVEQALRDADDRAERSAATAAVSAKEANDAESHAHREGGRYERLRANVGDDAERAVRELATAREQIRDIGERKDRATAESIAVGKAIASLTERLNNLEHQRTRAHEAANEAAHRFDVVCSEQIAEVLDLPDIGPHVDAITAARRVLADTEPVTDDATNRMEKALREILLDGLRAGHDPAMPKVDGIDVVRVGTADGELPIGTLARQLRDEHERTSNLLSRQEREIFETHLLTRVGDALRQLLLEADGFEQRINAEMAKVPTESGMVVELRWEVADDERGLRRAVDTLRSAPEMLGPEQREQLREFFMHRIADLRAGDPGLSFAETLTTALDYRSWHQFSLFARFADGKRQRVTRKFYRGLSGGEAATLLHLPLFAAAAAQYSAGTVRGPRLIALDEAFAGIDDQMRGRLMGLLTQLDLDVILTSHEFWGFYGSVPSLVLYDLIRRPPTPGVFAQRFDWIADDQTPTEL